MLDKLTTQDKQNIVELVGRSVGVAHLRDRCQLNCIFPFYDTFLRVKKVITTVDMLLDCCHLTLGHTKYVRLRIVEGLTAFSYHSGVDECIYILKNGSLCDRKKCYISLFYSLELAHMRFSLPNFGSVRFGCLIMVLVLVVVNFVFFVIVVVIV